MFKLKHKHDWQPQGSGFLVQTEKGSMVLIVEYCKKCKALHYCRVPSNSKLKEMEEEG